MVVFKHDLDLVNNYRSNMLHLFPPPTTDHTYAQFKERENPRIKQPSTFRKLPKTLVSIQQGNINIVNYIY